MSEQEVQARCDKCGKSLSNSFGINMWVFGTTYDQTGEDIKTGLEPDLDVDADYKVFCQECARLYTDTWNSIGKPSLLASYGDEDEVSELTGQWYCSNWETPEQTAKAVRLCQLVTEALHGSLDGWEESHKDVILAFLADVALADVDEQKRAAQEG